MTAPRAWLRRSLLSEDVPGPVATAAEDWFDPADTARARRFSRGHAAISLADGPLSLAALVAAARNGRRARRLVLRATGGRLGPAAFALGAGAALAGTGVGLPAALARYGWGRRYGLVTQPFRSWLADLGKAAGIQATLGGLLAVGGASLMRRSPRMWWLGLWALFSGAVLALSLLGPLLLEPLFQKTKRLEDGPLRDDVEDLARRLGVPVRDVVVSDASQRTTGSNAYVSGLGRTRHVVFFDTLLEDASPDEVRFVAAHELAHVAHRHVVKLCAVAATLSLPACLAAFGVASARTGVRRREPERILRRLGIAGATATAAVTIASPLAAWMSRAFEREADWAALRATGRPESLIELFRTLAPRNLVVPDPPAWRRWLASHPSPLERIGLALRARG